MTTDSSAKIQSIVKSQPLARRILWVERLGFLSLICLSWLNELCDFSHALLGGENYTGNWRESVLETTMILLVWSVVGVMTRRLTSRLFYLEGFLKICAWCKKINHDGEWLPMEQYFMKGYQIQTSHGMCPQCAKDWLAKSKKP